MSGLTGIEGITILLVLGVLLAVLLVLVSLLLAVVDRVRGPSQPFVRAVPQRLAELDALLERGDITLQEHSEARLRVLTEG